MPVRRCFPKRRWELMRINKKDCTEALESKLIEAERRHVNHKVISMLRLIASGKHTHTQEI